MDPMATHCRKLIVTGIYQGVPSARRFYFFIRSVRVRVRHDAKFIIYFIYETFNDNSAFFKLESKTLFSI
jgi:hypothetical protein